MKKVKLTLFLVSLMMLTTASAQNSKVELPIPTEAQKTWQDAELTVVFHYDLHVCDGKVYNQAYNRTTPIEDINIFNPTKLDTDQWIRSAKAMGAKIAILTATHETGFALYQSEVNHYSMKALKFQDGKGDIVRDFVNSCRKYGIKPGIYIGIRWNSYLGVYDFMMPDDGTEFQKNRQKAYNKMCEDMTEELMSRYGELAIVWYDGGGHGPEHGGADILPIVEKYQKNIIFYHNTQRADIRWGGSESGTVPYPSWGTFPFQHINGRYVPSIYANDFAMLKTGDPEGKYYSPAMSDAPLRGYKGHDWFWEPDSESKIFPLKNLINMYEKSVGHNSTLILGVTPNADGLLPKADSLRLQEFGDAIRKRFSVPLVSKKDVHDEDVITLKVPKGSKVHDIVIEEDINYGERVRSFKVESKVNGKWVSTFEGTAVGHKLIIPVSDLESNLVKLTIEKSVAEPKIKHFAVY